MNKSTALFLIALASCQGSSSSQSVPFVKEEARSQPKVQYDGPIVLENSDQVIIPLSGESVGTRKIYSSDGYESEEQFRYWNFLFCNRKTGETKLLTDKKLSISEIDASTSDSSRNPLFRDKLFYKIRDKDFNLDGLLNTADPEGLFVSATDGTSLRRLSPEGESMLHYMLMKDQPQILISVYRDTKKDSVFNQEDDLIWYKAEFVGEDWKLSEMVDEARRKELDALYLKHWDRKEK